MLITLNYFFNRKIFVKQAIYRITAGLRSCDPGLVQTVFMCLKIM